ncbi:MAG TPA: hypothetical protein VGD55_12985, partial [Acidothermaceae bacterium]
TTARKAGLRCLIAAQRSVMRRSCCLNDGVVPNADATFLSRSRCLRSEYRRLRRIDMQWRNQPRTDRRNGARRPDPPPRQWRPETRPTNW